MTAGTVLHHAALALAVAALLGAGLRTASLAAPRGPERAIAAVTLAAAAAVAEALALGLVSLGGSSVALVLAALATWVAARLLLSRPDVPVREELALWWRGARTWEAAALGAVVGAWAAWTVWQVLNPALGRDMVLYHLPEAVSWVHNGRPGSVLQIISIVPVGNYPVTHEVLLAWGLGIGRSFVWVSVVMAAVPVVTAAAAWVGLRSLGVGRLAAGLAAAALVATPAVVAWQNGGAALDPAALAWLASCSALCAGARARPALVAPALVAAGLAVGTKTSAAPLAITVLVLTGFALRRRLRGLVPGLSAAAALAVAVGAVWYIRNLVSHGWPLWPFSSAPWGDPRPPVIASADVRFIQRPGDTLSRLGDYYWHHFGGPLVLLGGALLVALLVRSRPVVAASLATAASVLVWMNAPFTGVLASRALDVGTGDATRYLLPGVAAAVLAVALASRQRGIAGSVAIALLGAGMVVGLYDTFSIGFPGAPSPRTPILGAALGGSVCIGLMRSGLPPLPRRTVAVASLAILGLVGAAAADGYVERHGDTATRESRVAGWLAKRKAWRDGDAPVFSTWSLVGTLAGDRLRHPLVLVDGRNACRRTASTHGSWLVLDLHEQQAERARLCGRPGYSDGDFAAYAPRQVRAYGGGGASRVAAP